MQIGNNQSTLSQNPQTAYWPWSWVLLATCLMLMSVGVWLYYEPTVAAGLLAVVAIGVLQALLFSAKVSTVGGLAVMAAWMMWQQENGLWYEVDAQTNVLFTAMLAVNMAAAGYGRYLWSQAQTQMMALAELQQMLLSGEEGTGLVNRSVAELRLQEELDRSEQSQLPVGVILFDMKQTTSRPVSREGLHKAQQAMIRRLVAQGARFDLPFRLDADRIGVILPLRRGDRLRRDTIALSQAVRSATYQTKTGLTQPSLDLVQLGIGFAISEVAGHEDKVTEATMLMQSAECRLQGRAVAKSHTQTSVTQAALLETQA